MTRLLQKNKWKLKDTDISKGKGGDAYDDDRQAVQSQSYEQWNEALAKKFAVMYKKYLKFRMSVMKNENDEEVTKLLENGQISENEDEDAKADEAKQDEEKPTDKQPSDNENQIEEKKGEKKKSE